MLNNYAITKNLAIKELKLKYKQSALGFLWSMITPLVFLLIFNFVFSHAFIAIENYSLYVLTGLVFWQFFSNATNQSIQSFLRNTGIIKTINIPTFIYPLASIITEIIGLAIAFIPFLIIMYFFGLKFSWHFILIFPALFFFSLFAYGISLFMGVLNIYLRDVAILWNTLNPALFYLTPIAYNESIIPANYVFYLKLNPLFHFFEVFRAILYYNEMPSLKNWMFVIGLSVTVWVVGRFTLIKLEKGIISNI